jgi:4-methylaminobutanoate oxidase (formaldehyde-forming)
MTSIPERLANPDMSASRFGGGSGDLPSSARVVIVGAGIIGSSVAYHLSKLGWTDIVVLERHALTSGTSWHAAGLVSQVRGTHAMSQLARLNVPLYSSLEAETGIPTGFRQVGSLSVARTEARMTETLYGVTLAHDAGVQMDVLTPAEVQGYWPAAAVDDLVGGAITPNDGTVNPGDAALALAKGAHDRGVAFFEGVRVTGFTATAGAVTGVVTDGGTVGCEYVVLASGLWSSELGRLAGVPISLYPAEHVWVMTDPSPNATESLPFLRDLDGYLYIRRYNDRFVVGAFEPKGKPISPRTVGQEFSFGELGPDWDHFAPVLANARERLPELNELGFHHYLRGPESFTPDVNFNLGESPELRGFFVAAGFNSQGIIYGPGAGTALAEWIVSGAPTYDLTEVDPARSGGWANNRAWLHERTAESLGRLYAMHWPNLQPTTARGPRRTPLWNQLDGAGAVFGEAAGWERANWFAPAGAKREYVYSFGKQNWFEPVETECRAARQSAALFDLSTYAKFMVEGPDALTWLQRLSASDVDVPAGRVVYTTWCNERGGIELDPTVTRLDESRFLVAAPTMWQRRTEWLLRRGAPPGAVITDVTGGYAVLAVQGPRSRDVLVRLTDADLSDEALPFLAAASIDAGWSKAWALRVSYVGELGWELWVPTEFAADLHDKLMEAGRDIGITHAGFHALDALRIERGFRSWGHDIGGMDDPFAAGLGFTVSKHKSVHLGAPALAALRDEPRTRRLVSVRLRDPEPVLVHGESLVRDGSYAGFVTSGGYGYTLGAATAIAWLRADVPITPELLHGSVFEVEIATDRFAADVQLEPFYDPTGARLRG